MLFREDTAIAMHMYIKYSMTAWRATLVLHHSDQNLCWGNY